MKHSNISIFVPHAGCPHQCSFCNQKTISGAQYAPTADDVHRICRQALNEVRDKKNCEIAFFGGSFTAINRGYMTSLLEAAKCYIGAEGFRGVRISTRPDFIDRDILELLRSYGVTSIELGAQSMKNHVLEANERGHTAEDVYNASALIREYGFELGLQMMVGLYRSSVYDERKTTERIMKIHPDTVRIYPVVVLLSFAHICLRSLILMALRLLSADFMPRTELREKWLRAIIILRLRSFAKVCFTEKAWSILFGIYF